MGFRRYCMVKPSFLIKGRNSDVQTFHGAHCLDPPLYVLLSFAIVSGSCHV